MDLVEIDRLHPEPFTAGREFLLDGLPGESLGVRVVLAHLVVHFRRDDRLLAVALQRLAEDPLGLASRVHVRRVEEVDPEVDRAVDDLLALLVFQNPLAPVARAEAHTAEAESADFHARVSERRILHAGAYEPDRKNSTWPGNRRDGLDSRHF